MAMSARQLRQLEEIEAELESSQPRLTAMFDMFTELTAGERANGAERLPRRGWKRGAGRVRPHVPRRQEILALFMLAVAVTLGVVFASRGHPAPRPCPGLAVTAQPQVTPLFAIATSAVPASPGCTRYIANK